MSIFASRWRQACEGALSFLSEKKGVGKAMGRECCVAGYSNSSQKCSSCSYSVVFFHLFCSVLATTTPLGEKRGAELAAKSARGAFFQSSSVRLGHQKKSPDWRQRCWWWSKHRGSSGTIHNWKLSISSPLWSLHPLDQWQGKWKRVGFYYYVPFF